MKIKIEKVVGLETVLFERMNLTSSEMCTKLLTFKHSTLKDKHTTNRNKRK